MDLTERLRIIKENQRLTTYYKENLSKIPKSEKPYLQKGVIATVTYHTGFFCIVTEKDKLYLRKLNVNKQPMLRKDIKEIIKSICTPLMTELDKLKAIYSMFSNQVDTIHIPLIVTAIDLYISYGKSSEAPDYKAIYKFLLKFFRKNERLKCSTVTVRNARALSILLNEVYRKKKKHKALG